ncbi:MAG TPA: NAD(P)H-binding protein [Terriglobia bacterium]|nr:NAD(P)H-binding protein [Terriglobia bacterium]
MKIAITGGTGFVGRHLARALSAGGHEVVLIARGIDRRDESTRHLAGVSLVPVGTGDQAGLVRAFTGCDAVAHCAGINRELGLQTYQQVHVEGTRNVVSAAKEAGVKKLLMLSFLRARPSCGSGYHESKWAAEEIVRASGLDYTVLKAGMIYGRGDHMLDHLSHALHTFPVFASVGLNDTQIRPLAVEDVVRVIQAALDGRLSRQTVAVTGPEQMTLSEAARRVARVIGTHALIIRLPVFVHCALAWCFERTMKIPLVALAQVRILAEGVVEPQPPCDSLPDDLLPETRFTEQQIRAGLPEARPFGLRDLRGFA